MSDTEYTPTTDAVRHAYGWYGDGINLQSIERRQKEAFDRWLAAHDAQVRADEGERIAEAIRDSVPYGYGMNPDGTEDALAAAYVDGVRDAYFIVKGEPTDSEVEK